MPETEGTYRLAGLLEGKVSSNSETVLKQWQAETQAVGLELTLSIDGGMFSVIPRTEDSQTKRFNTDLSDLLQTALGNLMDALPEEGWRNAMCTLRSVEILPGKERQSLYSIGTGGEIRVEQREIEARTVPPPEPMDPRKLATRIGIGAGILVLLFLASLPFVPYRSLWERASSNLFAIPAENLRIELGPFEDYLELVEVGRSEKNRQYYLLLEPTDRFYNVIGKEDWRGGLSIEDQLAIEDLVREEIEIEMETSDSKVIKGKEIPLLRDEQSLEYSPSCFVMYISPHPRLETVRFEL